MCCETHDSSLPRRFIHRLFGAVRHLFAFRMRRLSCICEFLGPSAMERATRRRPRDIESSGWQMADVYVPRTNIFVASSVPFISTEPTNNGTASRRAMSIPLCVENRIIVSFCKGTGWRWKRRKVFVFVFGRLIGPGQCLVKVCLNNLAKCWNDVYDKLYFNLTR